MDKRKKIVGFIGWRPFSEDNKYAVEWINTTVINQIEEISSINDIWYISSCKLLGCIEDYENFQFYFCEVINKKHIFNLTFSNFEYFLKNTLKHFDIIVTSHHHYPFMMLINKYAKKYGVKVIFVQHGMQNDINKDVGKARLKGFINKYTFSSYIGLLRQLVLSLKIDSKVTYLVIKNILSKGSALIYPKYIYDEYKYTLLKVYSESEKKVYLKIYDENKIDMMLDPDIKLYLNYKGEKYKSQKPYILYIDDEVIKDYELYNEFNNFVDEYINKGYNFLYLPRARNDQKPKIEKLNKKIKFIEPRTINKYIDNVEFVISTWSTLLNLPIYLEKNIKIIINNEIMKTFTTLEKYKEFKKYKNIEFVFLR